MYEDDGKWDSGKRWFQRPLPFPPGERVTYVGVCGYWHEELLQREIKRNPGKVVIG